MKKFIASLLLLFVPTVTTAQIDQCVYPLPTITRIDTPPGPFKAFYTTPLVPEEQELKGLQVPVPRSCRVLNTKGNCVWTSLELLGRYAEIRPLYDISAPPSKGGDPRCQGGTWWPPVKTILDEKGIRYDVVWPQDKRRTDFFVKYCKVERRGVAFDIPGHCLVMVDWDEEKGLVKVIDNADRSLSVQTWKMERFKKLFGGWAFTVFGNPDIVPMKYNPWTAIPIVDGITGKPIPTPRELLPIPNN